jgi:hypothetical protein
MKLTALICTAFSVTFVGAAAIADPFCHHEGGACWKVKRAAEAVAEAFAEPNAAANAAANAEAWCQFPGEPCSRAIHAAESLAAVVAESQPNPALYFKSLRMRDAFPSPYSKPEAG